MGCRAETEAGRSHGTRSSTLCPIGTSKDRIPYGSIRDGYVYNFWKDDANPLGLWRRVKLAETP